MEEDKSKNCVNYPYGKYEDYNDCDEDFLGKQTLIERIIITLSPMAPEIIIIGEFWGLGCN